MHIRHHEYERIVYIPDKGGVREWLDATVYLKPAPDGFSGTLSVMEPNPGGGYKPADGAPLAWKRIITLSPWWLTVEVSDTERHVLDGVLPLGGADTIIGGMLYALVSDDGRPPQDWPGLARSYFENECRRRR